MKRGKKISLAREFVTSAGKAIREILDLKAPGSPLTEDEPRGLQKGNPVIWAFVRTLFLPVFGYANWWQTDLPLLNRIFKRRLELKGKENIEKARELGKQGVILVTDHRSSADVFMPQIILYLFGFKDIAEKLLFYVVGLKFVNQELISVGVRSRTIVPIVPPTMIPKKRPPVGDPLREVFLQQIRIAMSINRKARQVSRRLLKTGLCMYIAPEGTRSRKGPMAEARPEVTTLLNVKGAKILPVAQEGVENMWPVDGWPWPFTKVRLIVGEPVPVEEVVDQANVLSCTYGVDFNRAFVDVIMRKIALLHIEKGDPWYAGYYEMPLEERYEMERAKKER